MSTIETTNNKQVINSVNYNSEYIFKIDKKYYFKLLYETILLIIILGLLLSVSLLALIKYSEQNNNCLLVTTIILLSIIIVVVSKGMYIEYKKIYPNVIFEFKKGNIYYCDGKKTYDFNVKSIYSLSFKQPYYKSEKWIISIRLLGSFDEVQINILKMNDSELLYRLLTNFNTKIKIY